MKYSLIIPVYNRPNEVDELLQSLLDQRFKDRIPTNPATANVRRRATISQLPRKCVASRIVIWRFCDCTMVPFAEKKTG